MGAHDISFELNNKASKTEIEEAFKRQVDNDSEYNGHREGYSGDFQTVDKVDYTHLGQVFNSYSEAYDYCLKHARKWETVIAVYYVDAPIVKSKLLDRAVTKLKQLHEALANTHVLDKTNEFKTCKNCKSRIATKYLQYVNCLVCKNDLRTQGLKNKEKAIEEKIKALSTQKEHIIKKLQEKAAKKNKNVKTLVCGWGAS